MSVRDIVAIALFTAIIAVLGIVPAVSVLGLPVPITAQNLGVMLAGALLGAKRGFYSVALIWLLVAIGMPILAGGRGSLQAFFSPTTGYLIGWGGGAWTIGYLYRLLNAQQRLLKELLALFIGGIVVIHLFGIVWLSLFAHLPLAKTALADLIFVPGDVLKIILALAIIRQIRRGMPDMF